VGEWGWTDRPEGAKRREASAQTSSLALPFVVARRRARAADPLSYSARDCEASRARHVPPAGVCARGGGDGSCGCARASRARDGRERGHGGQREALVVVSSSCARPRTPRPLVPGRVDRVHLRRLPRGKRAGPAISSASLPLPLPHSPSPQAHFHRRPPLSVPVLLAAMADDDETSVIRGAKRGRDSIEEEATGSVRTRFAGPLLPLPWPPLHPFLDPTLFSLVLFGLDRNDGGAAVAAQNPAVVAAAAAAAAPVVVPPTETSIPAATAAASSSALDAAEDGTLAVYEGHGGGAVLVALLRPYPFGSTFRVPASSRPRLEPGRTGATTWSCATVLRRARAGGFSVEEKVDGEWDAVDVDEDGEEDGEEEEDEEEEDEEDGDEEDDTRRGELVVYELGTGPAAAIHVLTVLRNGRYYVRRAARAVLEPGSTGDTNWTRATVLRRVRSLGLPVKEKRGEVLVDVDINEELGPPEPADAAPDGTLAVFKGDAMHMLPLQPGPSSSTAKYGVGRPALRGLMPGKNGSTKWTRATVLINALVRGWAVKERVAGEWVEVKK
jgi:hypothetical protein